MSIKMNEVNSSQIHAIGHNPETNSVLMSFRLMYGQRKAQDIERKRKTRANVKVVLNQEIADEIRTKFKELRPECKSKTQAIEILMKIYKCGNSTIGDVINNRTWVRPGGYYVR